MKKQIIISTLNFIVLISLTTIYGFKDNLFFQSLIFNIIGTAFYIYLIFNVKSGTNHIKVNMLIELLSITNLYLLSGGIYILLTNKDPSEDSVLILLFCVVTIYIYNYFIKPMRK